MFKRQTKRQRELLKRELNRRMVLDCGHTCGNLPPSKDGNLRYCFQNQYCRDEAKRRAQARMQSDHLQEVAMLPR